ncbi:MAG: sugar nucleotide-binding protein [Acidobacteria bacterium]|nr:sugar nucleotide-binding protein [Acidobacteriota bacterium]
MGRALGERFEDLFPHTVSATRTEVDITDRWRLEAEIERLQPTLVINAAAVADVDRCERDPLLARRANVEGAENAALSCRAVGARLIHLSTDYVFGGYERAGEYDETDPPAPVNEYGRTKAEGESAVLDALVDCAVVRVSFVFGRGARRSSIASSTPRATAQGRSPRSTLGATSRRVWMRSSTACWRSRARR